MVGDALICMVELRLALRAEGLAELLHLVRDALIRTVGLRFLYVLAE